MKRLALVLLLLLPCVGTAQEVVNLTVPESTSQYHVSSMVIDVDNGVLSVTLTSTTNTIVSCSYTASTNPTGASLILGLNKANLSSAYAGNATTGSLKQRVNHHLVVMGESAQVCSKTLTGTLAGTVP
jgi:hypothetical protein